ncbi:MAG: excinuclease ABC subunit C, partial [bacterium]|nr:excinuclease ABC subunit C [bacterium]
VIDGGRGQLNAALEEMQILDFRLQIPTIGLAKKLEEIYLPDKKDPIRLSEDSPALHLLQRMRDEAHRFAITFYRGRHEKEMTRTKLNEIAGIGPVVSRKLLKHFGSVSGIRAASLEALAREVGLVLAKKLKEQL